MVHIVIIARNAALAYKIAKAAVGLMLLAHGTYRWVQLKREHKRKV